jgi:hypothetical protein
MPTKLVSFNIRKEESKDWRRSEDEKQWNLTIRLLKVLIAINLVPQGMDRPLLDPSHKAIGACAVMLPNILQLNISREPIK